MAEFDDGTDLGDEGAGADEPQTAPGVEGQADVPEGEPGDRLVDKTGAGPEDPNDPQYKYWQTAYTQTRMRERERYGQVESEHKQYGDALRNFYNDDAYALQVFRQRFPQLAHHMTLNGGTPGTPPASPRPEGTISPTTQRLQERMGSDLGVLAPQIGPAIDEAIEAAIQARLAPLEQRTQQQQAQSRKAVTERLMAELDAQHPGWEARYGKDMQEIDAFLGGDELEHPRHGNRYQLLFKLANPDQARVAAVRSMQTSGRNRLSTGRTNRQAPPDSSEAIVAASKNDAFWLAAEAARQELRRA
jgi:hypothetical protein